MYTDVVYKDSSEMICLYDQYKDTLSFKSFATQPAIKKIFSLPDVMEHRPRIYSNLIKSFPPDNMFTKGFPSLASVEPKIDNIQTNMFYGQDLNKTNFKVKKTTIEFAGRVKNDAFATIQFYSPLYINYETSLSWASFIKRDFTSYSTALSWATLACIPTIIKQITVLEGVSTTSFHIVPFSHIVSFMPPQGVINPQKWEERAFGHPQHEYSGKYKWSTEDETWFTDYNIPKALRCRSADLLTQFKTFFGEDRKWWIWLNTLIRIFIDNAHLGIAFSGEMDANNVIRLTEYHNDWEGALNGQYGYPVDPGKMLKSTILRLYRSNRWAGAGSSVDDPTWNVSKENIWNSISTAPLTLKTFEMIELIRRENSFDVCESNVRIMFYNCPPVTKTYLIDFIIRVCTIAINKYNSETFDHALSYVVWGLSRAASGIYEEKRFSNEQNLPYNIEGDFAYQMVADPTLLDSYTRVLNSGILKIKTFTRNLTLKASGHPVAMLVYPTNGAYLKFIQIVKFDFKSKFWFFNDFKNKKVRYKILSDDARTWYGQKCPGLFLGDIDFMSKNEGGLLEL